MLQVTDVRETRVFQEALEEGEEKGRREALEAVILGMLDADRPVAEIAKITGLSAARIRAINQRRKIGFGVIQTDGFTNNFRFLF